MRLRSVTTAAIVFSLAGAAPAAAEPGDPYVNSCNSWADIPTCTRDVLGTAATVEVSPDGKHVYIATWSPVTSILLYDRTPTGAITRRAGPQGCVVSVGGGCVPAANMNFAWDMAFSADGRQLYY